jgi:hypothetical protein
MRIHKSFIRIIIFFGEAFQCGDGVIFWGYVWTQTDPLCIEFRNFLLCHTLVNYLTFAINERNKSTGHFQNFFLKSM